MTNNPRDAVLHGLLEDVNAVTGEAQQAFGNLSARQLNWKPVAENWSVGQCLDHLMTTNKTYFPAFERIARGEKKNTLWEGMPLLPAFFGKMIVKSLGPEGTRKLKAPQVFRPSSSDVDAGIVGNFVEHQKQLVNLMEAMRDVNAEKVKVTSPASGLIAYSLLDAYKIIVTHERRHINQAKTILETRGFPR